MKEGPGVVGKRRSQMELNNELSKKIIKGTTPLSPPYKGGETTLK